MIYKFIKYSIIKCFPSNLLDYVGYFFYNFIFALLIVINIPLINSFTFKDPKSSYILFIPKILNNFEEKKDLIFTDLSLNTNIISVKEIDKKIIAEKLSKKLDFEFAEDSLIPEAFEIVIKKNKNIQLDEENKKLNEILKGTEIIKKEKGYEFKLRKFLFFLILFTLFILFLFILQIDYAKKCQSFMEKSRAFGAKDKDLLYNISLGYFIFQLSGIFIACTALFFYEKYTNNYTIFLIDHYLTLTFTLLMQSLFSCISLLIILNHSLRKII